jgi:hypothetical protein
MTPKPFVFNKKQVKAFVLGADPTNFSDRGKPIELTYAFGIGQDARYFRDILENLNKLGLHLEDVYIQNLLPEIQQQVTTGNKKFVNDAGANATAIAAEFNKIDPSRKLPVFITAEKLYEAVMNKKNNIPSCSSYYSLETNSPIGATENKLGRPAIPLFRNRNYKLEHWPEYTKYIRSILDTN